MRHSHVFNFCVIFFKLISYVLQLIVLYGIANQRFRFISSIQMAAKKNRKTVKKQNLRKSKNKAFVNVDWEPLMTNMAIFRLSLTYLTFKLTEKAEILKFRYQLYSTTQTVLWTVGRTEYSLRYTAIVQFSQKC